MPETGSAEGFDEDWVSFLLITLIAGFYSEDVGQGSQQALMKQFSSIFLTALLYGAACLASGNALARGGSGGHSSGSHGGSVHVSGYTRKDGTYVAPYTRSAPGSSSGYKNSSGYSSQPVDSQSPSKTYSSDSNDSTDSQS